MTPCLFPDPHATQPDRKEGELAARVNPYRGEKRPYGSAVGQWDYLAYAGLFGHSCGVRTREEHVGDGIKEGVKVKGLLDKPGRAPRYSVIAQLRAGRAGDNGCVVIELLVVAGEERCPIHDRHQHVEDDEVGLPGLREFKAHRAVRGRAHGVAFVFQQRGHEPADARFVINNEDTGRQ